MLSKYKKRLVTGIKPTGELTLGNYLGIIKPFLSFQEKFLREYEFYFFIADLHALTDFQEPTFLKEKTKEMLYLLLSLGIDLDKTNLFIQSSIPQHTYLNYIMESTSYLGELKRMIQFKEKKKSSQNTRVSLLTYPLLMSSDILLYDADFVPVGSDQKQHLELTRNLAKRFNNLYGQTFVIPHTLQLGTIIQSLTCPNKKMSKSSSDKGCISILENLDNIRKKILKSVTDSENNIKYDLEKKPGISNLLNIYSLLKDWDLEKTEKYFQNFSYKIFKEKVAELLIKEISKIQNKYYFLRENINLNQILKKGTEKALMIANNKIKEIQEKLGINVF
ncbi:MAG: tryptophan--tRNA ligase [Candidatus Phytoplasma stylosanthis]|uniref:tryptophan--tRNA ligase n=1 Tax=Candidatus Phytoplasma stylosanthis TaxID=2798314 RepID=UPI002939711A|nr:tryptophan--tRNA ligase [Candidatus Phytoplasma stylosanthis]MDV3167978.1 tryptophan--tRNA ligase [Candidatus Phytoplasma stylosanthis]MDV3170779.1 tryptophan--tRNA ligase [Candidatus Phytoplasma stylosanthis]MDV3173547.1 tryptophan--tRNA ligase [Candidatus Phytoplasma stylosanthis]MDV3174291.1 tryptophan--tRNA ligase [Candidatus Phytoplasma stylosanthis]MDV3202732.1 tryptophan--tRNA ligase [Candidatus Phytoplasma stylosanthis]